MYIYTRMYIYIYQTRFIWNLSTKVILIKFTKFAQLEVYNFKYSQHDLLLLKENHQIPSKIKS